MSTRSRPGASMAEFVFTCPRCHRSSAHPKDRKEGFCGRCHDWTGQGLKCPGCGQHAALQVFGQMAMCGNDECRVISWDPDQPILEQQWNEWDLSPFAPPQNGQT